VNLDDTICYCFHVTKRKIVNFIRIRKPRRASQVSECGGAGSGCGWCVSYLRRYFAEASGQSSENISEGLTAQQYAQQRGEYIRSGGGTPPAGAIPPPDASGT